MAPRYMGTHLEQECEECGYLCQFYPPEILTEVPCPNCGFKLSIASASKVIGEKVVVSRRTHPPERWMTIAFDHPEKPAADNHLSIKRVIGLPNETVEIRKGDIFVDGQRQSKPWARQLEMSLLVHDANFTSRNPSAHQFAKGWQTDTRVSGWQLKGACWKFDSSQGKGRIEFQNFPSFQRSGNFDPRSPQPVLDDLSFDPAESRNLQRVDDLLLTAMLTDRGSKFSIEFRLTEPCLTVLFDSKNQSIVAEIDEQQLAVGRWKPLAAPVQLGVSNFDGFLTVVLNGQDVIRTPIVGTNPAAFETAGKPWAIVGEDGQFDLTGLQVRRDIYHLPAMDESQDELSTIELGEREYFVLGDNPIDSVDSRHWKHPGLDAKRILGEVKQK